jgi:hypothetical protein
MIRNSGTIKKRLTFESRRCMANKVAVAVTVRAVEDAARAPAQHLSLPAVTAADPGLDRETEQGLPEVDRLPQQQQQQQRAVPLGQHVIDLVLAHRLLLTKFSDTSRVVPAINVVF